MADDAGIIPANTGKMMLTSHKWERPQDHPREYGENCSIMSAHCRDTGSSPRIRGKCVNNRTGVRVRGIIPANTGKIFPPP